MGTSVRHETLNLLGGFLRASLAVLAMLTAGFLPTGDSAALEIFPTAAEVIGAIEHPRVSESSGLAPSRRRPDMLWTHNDSGDGPRLYASTTNGKHLAVVQIRGVRARDWEDIASFVYREKPFLLIADIGDNLFRRQTCTMVVVEEPPVPDTPTDLIIDAEPAWKIDFTYEDGPRDAEAAAVYPQDGRIFILSKHHDAVGLYELPLVPEADGKTVALRVATLPPILLPVGEKDGEGTAEPRVNAFQPTAMDISADGLQALVVTYLGGYLFLRDPQKPWEEAFSRPPLSIPLPPRAQGESGCFSGDGRSIIIGTEGRPSTLWRISLDRR